jgi:dihydrofolate reductase
MWRKTYESLPEAFRPLPWRHNIVLSKSWESPLLERRPEGSTLGVGVGGDHWNNSNTSLEIISDIQNIINKKDSPDNIFIIGWSQIYNLLLPYCDQLIITEVKWNYEGDTYFPEFTDQFTETSRESHDTHDFVIYGRTPTTNI